MADDGLTTDSIERIKRLAIIALFSDDELVDRLVLKGGNALSFAYGLNNRVSADIDLSMSSAFTPQELVDVRSRIEYRLKQTFGGDVEEQLAWQALSTEGFHCLVPTEHFQFGELAVLPRRSKEHQGRMKRAVGRPAAQGLVADDLLLYCGNDGLEKDRDVAAMNDIQQLFQRIHCSLRGNHQGGWRT